MDRFADVLELIKAGFHWDKNRASIEHALMKGKFSIPELAALIQALKDLEPEPQHVASRDLIIRHGEERLFAMEPTGLPDVPVPDAKGFLEGIGKQEFYRKAKRNKPRWMGVREDFDEYGNELDDFDFKGDYALAFFCVAASFPVDKHRVLAEFLLDIRSLSHFRRAQAALLWRAGAPMSEELYVYLRKHDREELDVFLRLQVAAQILDVSLGRLNPESYRRDVPLADQCGASHLEERFKLSMLELVFEKPPRGDFFALLDLSKKDWSVERRERLSIKIMHPSKIALYQVLRHQCRGVGVQWASLALIFLDTYYYQHFIGQPAETPESMLLDWLNARNANFFARFSVAEVGSNHINDSLLGLFGPYVDQSGSDYQFVGEDEIVNLDSYERFFPEPFDYGMTSRVFDQGSTGLLPKKEDMLFVELFCVFANIVKPGGIVVHFGEPIPGIVEKQSLFELAGLERIENIRTQTGEAFVFKKLDDRKVTPVQARFWYHDFKERRRF
jgi:hypothetical protein